VCVDVSVSVYACFYSSITNCMYLSPAVIKIRIKIKRTIIIATDISQLNDLTYSVEITKKPSKSHCNNAEYT